MPSCYAKFGILSLLFLLLQYKLTAQYSLEGFELDGDVYTWHDRALGAQGTGILLGEHQQIKRISRNTHPFFSTDRWWPGKIRYRGEIYDSIYLMYDIHDDVLIFRHPTKLQYHSQAVKPNQEQVDWFELAGHTFKYYPGEMLQFPPGFFDQLYVGKEFDLVAKRAKGSRAETTIVYIPNDMYLVRVKDEYHRIKRKRSILRLFKGQKGEVRKFIRENELQIRPGNEQDLILLARFCDELLTDQN